MPAQRVSKSFKDLSMSFKFNPLSGDLIALKNENAIARAVRNIVLTTPGEKLFNPDFGSSISYDKQATDDDGFEMVIDCDNHTKSFHLHLIELNPQ